MHEKNPKNISASVLQRLRNYAGRSQEDFGLTLTRYAIERLLYRLSISAYEKQFVLKGAQLFRLWADTPYRPTRDLDLLRYGTPDRNEMIRMFSEICTLTGEENDGIEFLPESIKAEPIREDSEYDGIRIRLQYRIGRTGQYIQIDVGFGDAVFPASARIQFPTMLDMKSPCIQAYPREAAIAEKVESMVTKGIANSRMKDFFDVYQLSVQFEFDGNILRKSIESTLLSRKTGLPETPPVAFTRAFYSDPVKLSQWKAFVRKSHVTGHVDASDFAGVIERISLFVLPVLEAIREKEGFDFHWIPAKGWTKE